MVPGSFLWRRLHSLMGLWLVLFLCEHLLTNSQAALWIENQGSGFVRAVNWLHNMPYLQGVEVLLLGVPFLVHIVWGVKYALQGKANVRSTGGNQPVIKTGRNWAYLFQRVSAWGILIILCIHVIEFRFLRYPHHVRHGIHTTYFTALSFDPGLYTLSSKMGFQIEDGPGFHEELSRAEESLQVAADRILQTASGHYDNEQAMKVLAWEEKRDELTLKKALSSVALKEGQVLISAPNFGLCTLMIVRDVFKSPWNIALYTIFVLFSVFHAFNGLWTAALTWGWIIRYGAQKGAVVFCIFLMGSVGFLGLAAIWGTYYFSLKF